MLLIATENAVLSSPESWRQQALGRVDIWCYHCGMANVELTSYQWDKILTFLRSRSDLYIGREDHCRRFVTGVLWIARSGPPCPAA